jgi:hypothetical protein
MEAVPNRHPAAIQGVGPGISVSPLRWAPLCTPKMTWCSQTTPSSMPATKRPMTKPAKAAIAISATSFSRSRISSFPKANLGPRRDVSTLRCAGCAAGVLVCACTVMRRFRRRPARKPEGCCLKKPPAVKWFARNHLIFRRRTLAPECVAIFVSESVASRWNLVCPIHNFERLRRAETATCAGR